MDALKAIGTQKPMKVLLVGATGYIGSALARRLYGDGHSCVALARESSDTSHIERFCQRIERGDCTDAEVVKKAATGCTAIVNLSWNVDVLFSSTENAFRADSGPLVACLEAGISLDVPVIHTSGNFGLDASKGGVVDETLPPPDREFRIAPGLNWVEPGVKAKVMLDRLVDRYVREKGAKAMVVIPGSVYGPSLRVGFWNVLIQQHILGEEVMGIKPFPPDCVTAYVHVEDVVSCFMAALIKGVPGGRYLVATETMKLSDFAALFADAAGVPFEKHQPVYENPNQIFYDDSKTRKQLGLTWERRAKTSLPATIEWLKSIGELRLG